MMILLVKDTAEYVNKWKKNVYWIKRIIIQNYIQMDLSNCYFYLI